jgi:fructose-bisphosphate aldolase class I
MDGDHTIERCGEVTEATLRAVFRELLRYRVALDKMLLKVNMVTAGKDCREQQTVAEVAEATLRCMKAVVPPSVTGIVFLSGGQDDLLATERLNAMNKIGNVPWQLGFSFARALQAPALQAWHGENVPAGQRALLHRAQCNSSARYGIYFPEMESERLAA